MKRCKNDAENIMQGGEVLAIEGRTKEGYFGILTLP